MRPRRRAALAAVLALAAFGLAGCGDPHLWARWKAERAFWRAQRAVERILVKPQVARREDFARAEAGFRAIVAAYPAARWARRGGTPLENEVAAIAGRSALALARLAELQSRSAEADSGYARAEREWAAIPELALEAAMLRAGALARQGREDRALAVWEHVARTWPAADGRSGQPGASHLQAVRQLADGLDARGSIPARDSLLAAEERVAESWLAAHPGESAAPSWIDLVAECRAHRGDAGGALAAARRALAGDLHLVRSERERRVLDLGERSLAMGRADSALAYGRWARGEFEGVARLRALDLQARAFRAGGYRDSALATYDRLLTEFPRRDVEAAEARFQRALIFEEMNRWQLARAEFSALCAATPTHPRALESWQRVVRHDREAGEQEIARIDTEHALDSFDQLLAMQGDERERQRIREARVAVLLAAGRTGEGIRDLQEIWSTSGVTVTGAAIGATAAREAETGLRDPALARSLWQILARSSPDREVRQRATVALTRLPS